MLLEEGPLEMSTAGNLFSHTFTSSDALSSYDTETEREVALKVIELDNW